MHVVEAEFQDSPHDLYSLGNTLCNPLLGVWKEHVTYFYWIEYGEGDRMAFPQLYYVRLSLRLEKDCVVNLEEANMSEKPFWQGTMGHF